MTVDFDSISKAVNNQPKLLNDTDVTNIRKIVDANPSLFESSWDQPKTKRRDAGVYLKKTIKDGVEVDSPKYAFLFYCPTAIDQYQLQDGTILNCPLFKYNDGTKGLWFDDDGNLEWELLHLSDEPPVLTPSINSICQLASDVTGNQDTQSLREYFNTVDNIDTDRHDWSFNTLWISTKHKSIKIGLSKTDAAWIPEDVYGILDKVCGSKNSNAYKNTEQMFSTLGIMQVETTHTILTPHVEFDSTGLKKEIGFEMGTSYSLDAPTGTNPMDDFGAFNSKQSSYKEGVRLIMADSKDYNWISDEWRDQLEVWDTNTHVDAVFGDVMVTSSKDGWKTDLFYGLSGSKTGQQPTNLI